MRRSLRCFGRFRMFRGTSSVLAAGEGGGEMKSRRSHCTGSVFLEGCACGQAGQPQYESGEL